MVQEKRAAVYCRTAMADEIAIENQASMLVEAAQKNGWREIFIYKDCGYPGSLLERPALKRLIADIQAQRIDAVIVKDGDRLARGMEPAVQFFRIADGSGVKVFFLAGGTLEKMRLVDGCIPLLVSSSIVQSINAWE